MMRIMRPFVLSTPFVLTHIIRAKYKIISRDVFFLSTQLRTSITDERKDYNYYYNPIFHCQ